MMYTFRLSVMNSFCLLLSFVSNPMRCADVSSYFGAKSYIRQYKYVHVCVCLSHEVVRPLGIQIYSTLMHFVFECTGQVDDNANFSKSVAFDFAWTNDSCEVVSHWLSCVFAARDTCSEFSYRMKIVQWLERSILWRKNSKSTNPRCSDDLEDDIRIFHPKICFRTVFLANFVTKWKRIVFQTNAHSSICPDRK